MTVGEELLDVPLPEMVSKLAQGIADAQAALDRNSVNTAEMLATETVNIVPSLTRTIAKDGTVTYPTPDKVRDSMVPLTLLQVGLSPTFYQFSEATIDVEMDIKTTTSSEWDVGTKAQGRVGWGLWSASVSTEVKHNRKFGKEVHGTSHLETTLVPVPPPENLMPEMLTIDQREDASNGGGEGDDPDDPDDPDDDTDE